MFFRPPSQFRPRPVNPPPAPGGALTPQQDSGVGGGGLGGGSQFGRLMQSPMFSGVANQMRFSQMGSPGARSGTRSLY